MTHLMCVEADAAKIAGHIDLFRTRFKNKLRHKAGALSVNGRSFKMMGAFEIDLKSLGTQAEASKRSQELIKKLGFNPKNVKAQYLLHLHAIVAPMTEQAQSDITALIEAANGRPLEPYQLNFRSLHANRSKNINLQDMAAYMFKARLQFADNVFADAYMQKQARYDTYYRGSSLINYLSAVNAMQNFKGLKFNFGI